MLAASALACSVQDYTENLLAIRAWKIDVGIDPSRQNPINYGYLELILYALGADIGCAHGPPIIS
jgi:hypothetical protein